MRVTYRLVQLAQVLMADPDGKHWGYQLMQDANMPSGVVYPLLSRMRDEGWVKMRTTAGKSATLGPVRRYYTLTAKGKRELDAVMKAAKSKGYT